MNVKRLTLLSLAALSLAGLGGCPKAEPEVKPAPVADARAPAAGAPKAAAPKAVVRVEKVGLATPESIRFDPVADLYLVSNINGSPLAADDNGFISRIHPDGRVKELKWIDGARAEVQLDAPKGMAIYEGVLYVADLDHLRRFDAKTGEPRGAVQIQGATFLNDVTVGPDGSIYVSDMGMQAGEEGFEPSGSDAIYRLRGKDDLVALVQDTGLERPNGLTFESETLRVVTFGANEFYSIEEGKKTRVVKLPAGRLDGIEATPEGLLLISSWEAKAIFAGPAAGPFEAVLEGLESPADIGYDPRRGRVLIPLFQLDALLFTPLPAKAE